MSKIKFIEVLELYFGSLGIIFCLMPAVVLGIL